VASFLVRDTQLVYNPLTALLHPLTAIPHLKTLLWSSLMALSHRQTAHEQKYRGLVLINIIWWTHKRGDVLTTENKGLHSIPGSTEI